MPEDRPKTGRHEQDDTKARTAREAREERDEQGAQRRALSGASPLPAGGDGHERREEAPLGGFGGG